METFFRLVHHGIRGKRTVPQLNGDGPIVDSSEVQQTTTVHSDLSVPQLNGDGRIVDSSEVQQTRAVHSDLSVPKLNSNGPIVDSSKVQQTTTVHSDLPVPQSNDRLHSASYFSSPNGENVTTVQLIVLRTYGYGQF